MNTTTTQPPAGPSAGPRKKGRVGLILGLAATLGLAALLGVRVKEALAERAALAAEQARQQTAKAETTGPKRAETKTTLGQPAKWRPVLSLTGTLAPTQEADVGFKMPGRLQTVKAKVGELVKAGALLATIDGSEMGAQAGVAAAGVHAAELALEMAKDGQRRVDMLFASNAISEGEKTAAAQRVALALAQLDQAKAQANLTTVSSANTRLSAPFAGYITRAPAGIGKIVQPGEPLFHVDDTSILKLNATLSEEDARLVDVGAAVAIEGAPEASGKVTVVLGSLDPMTRRVPIVAEIPNQPVTSLRAGAFVRAKITPAKDVDVIKLPASTLRAGSLDEIVVRREGKAHIARVVASIGEDGALLVREGVRAVDEVVLSPSIDVREGDAL